MTRSGVRALEKIEELAVLMAGLLLDHPEGMGKQVVKREDA